MYPLVHPTSSSCSQDVMLEALDQKVAEVHRCCVDDRMTNLSTLEKLAKIEDRMSLVLQSLESIPEESLKMLKKIMDRERRSRFVVCLSDCTSLLTAPSEGNVKCIYIYISMLFKTPLSSNIMSQTA